MRYIFHMNSRRRTEEKVFSYMEEHDMVSPGHRIVAGVSGGADSVCLLFVLLEYAARKDLKLAVVHVNHGIREDAGEDASFVRLLCERLQLPFFLKETDVRALAQREKCSLEEAGRTARYDAFREAARSFGADRIAVAHNGNDRAETMLFHLFRGSGIRGLCGILPRRGEIIRPLLCLERKEIEAYLEKRGIPYRQDSTNREDEYTRNRIRHHILPVAEKEVCTAAVAHMCRAADLLSETEDYLGMQTDRAVKDCVSGIAAGDGKPGEREDGMCAGFTVDTAAFCKLHIAVRRRVLLLLLKRLSPGGKDISAGHVEDILSLFEKEGSPRIDLPFGIRAVKSYGVVRLERETAPPSSAPAPRPVQVPIPEESFGETRRIGLACGGWAELSVFSAKKGQKIPQNEYTKWLDCDKMKKSLVFRFRETQDFLTLADGRGGIIHKSLQDYMVTEKIPREKRDRILLLAEGHHVIWLVGYRISEYYKVDGNTKRIFQVKLTENRCGGTEEKDGGTCQGTVVGGRGRRQDQGDRTADQQGL